MNVCVLIYMHFVYIIKQFYITCRAYTLCKAYDNSKSMEVFSLHFEQLFEHLYDTFP